MQWARRLHFANLMLRLLVSKVLPFAFSPPASIMASQAVSDDGSSPRTAMRDALRAGHATTRNLYIAGGLLVAAAVGAACHVGTSLAVQQCVAAGGMSSLAVVAFVGLVQQFQPTARNDRQSKVMG